MEHVLASLGAGAPGSLPAEQLRRHDDHRGRRSSSPRSSPAYAFAFLEFPLKRTLFFVFLATLMVPFEVMFFTNFTTVERSRSATTPTQGWPCRSSPPGSARSSSGRPSWSHRATSGRSAARRLRALALHVAGRRAAGAPGDRGARGLRVPRRVEPVPVAAHRHGRPEFRTVQVGLRSSSAGRASTRSTSRSRGSSSPSLPLFVLLLVFQKQLVRGLTAGAVKG